jgi:SAM-dependent methyltransferase
MQRNKSVWHNRDNEIIPVLLDLHAAVDNPLILDVTHNQGVMWQTIGVRYRLLTMDLDPQHGTNLVGDFTALPFRDGCFDVLVFDPPHLPNAGGSEGGSRLWTKRYGITSNDPLRDGDNIAGLFRPFLSEAGRVLKPDGIILAKIADLTHNHRYQWQHVDFINAVNALGMTACDMLIKEDPNAGNLQSSKWREVKHLRKSHAYWIVVRNSKSCESPVRPAAPTPAVRPIFSPNQLSFF